MIVGALTGIDWGVIALYLAGTVAVGLLCRGKQESSADYFTTSGTMGTTFHSLLVGLSIAAAFFSGISFLAVPSLVYSNNFAIVIEIFFFPILWAILYFWFLPAYLSRTSRHPYGVVEQRFGRAIRSLTAGMYILLRVGWMAALIYAPSMAIIGASRLNEEQWFWPIVLTIGLCSTFYTTIGGIRGVIFTDAIQFLVILLGITGTLLVIFYRLPANFQQIIHFWNDSGHLHIDFSPDPRKISTFWSMLIGINIPYFCNLVADQMSLQRYLSTGNPRASARSLAFNLIGVVLVIVLLAGIGLALAAWYHFFPDSNLPHKADQIFPYFIASVLPTGFSGLLLAAMLAATMSSMNGGINTLSAVLTLDFRTQFGSSLTEKQQLRFARTASFFIGVGATLVAGIVRYLGTTIFDMSQTLLGLFSAPTFLAVALAVSRIRIHRGSLAAGMILSVIAGAILIWKAGWASIWVCGVTCVIGFTLTFAGTLLFGPSSDTKENISSTGES